MTTWPDLHPIDLTVRTMHCWDCCDDIELEAQHLARDAEQESQTMPADQHDYELTLSFDCDHAAHAKMMIDYIVQMVATKVPFPIVATVRINRP